MKALNISYTGNAASNILVGNGVLDSKQFRNAVSNREVVLIADSTPLELYESMLIEKIRPVVRSLHTLFVEASEEKKSAHTWQRLIHSMLDAGFTRDTLLIGFGGGITLDVAGFVAATYMRGIEFVSIPTTLLAQVDAAIGGKTGINTRFGKNLIGAFHLATHVFCEPKFLETLSRQDVLNGIAETIKHAAIASEELFERLETITEEEFLTEDIIAASASIKANIINNDLQELGMRKILNFGHTAGHAIEQALDFTIPHGQAVAAGMLIECNIAQHMLDANVDDLNRIRSLVSKFELANFELPPFENCLAFMKLDKKNRNRKVHFSLPLAIGQMAAKNEGYTVEVPIEIVQQCWRLQP